MLLSINDEVTHHEPLSFYHNSEDEASGLKIAVYIYFLKQMSLKHCREYLGLEWFLITP